MFHTRLPHPINNIQNFDVNFTSWSLIMISDIPLCWTQMLKNRFAIRATMAFVRVNANFANFENMFTTLMGLGRAYVTQTFSCVLIWYFGTLRTCKHCVLCLLSFQANRKSSPTTSLLFFQHGVLPWACHALLT